MSFARTRCAPPSASDREPSLLHLLPVLIVNIHKVAKYPHGGREVMEGTKNTSASWYFYNVL
jgi:hypothetical protein